MKSSTHGAEGKKDVLLFDPENLVVIEDKKHPLYDERVTLPLDERLVLNIMHHGVLEPILVRKNAESGETEVVAGRQRVRACREANKRLKKQGAEVHRIPAMVKRADSHALMGMMISENEIRQDDGPLGKAKKMQRFLDLGRSEEEAATVFGVSVHTVKNMLRVLDAPKSLQTAVENGTITATDAYKLSKLDPTDQKEKLTELAKAPTNGVKRTREAGKKAREVVNGSTAPGKKEIKAKLEAVTSAEMPEQVRVGVCAALRWVLGGKEDLDAMLK